MGQRSMREEARGAQEGGPRAQQGGGRVDHALGALERRLVLSFLQSPPSRQKINAIFFPRFTEAAAEAKVLSYSGRGQILLHRSLR